MQGWQRERIVGTYSRQTIDCNGRHIVHDGDCGIYNAELGICTCGLHHCLMASSKELIDELYPKYHEEKTNEGIVAYMLQEFERDNLYVKDGDKFVKVEKPEPVSNEEAKKIFKDIFTKPGDKEIIDKMFDEEIPEK
jgi:hypothetical protein